MYMQATMRSQDVTVESVRLLSADLTAPPAQPQSASGGVNIAAIAGGVTAGAVVLMAAIAVCTWCFLQRRNAQPEPEAPLEPEHRADPFYCG